MAINGQKFAAIGCNYLQIAGIEWELLEMGGNIRNDKNVCKLLGMAENIDDNYDNNSNDDDDDETSIGVASLQFYLSPVIKPFEQVWRKKNCLCVVFCPLSIVVIKV